MKKLLGIVVLGLLLASCSEYFDKKKIDKCADPKAIEEGAKVATKNGKNIVIFLPDPENYDPAGIFEEENLEKLNKMNLKEKLAEKSGRYETIWDECEREFSLTPVKFKEKYSKP